MNKEQRKEYMKEYRIKNRDKNKEYQKRYKIKNRDKFKESQKKSYLKNREYYIKKQRDYFEKHGKAQNIKRRAKKREYHQNYRKNPDNQLKIKARVLTKSIVVVGLCEICVQNIATEKHHPNYNNPNQVQFVCGPCHRQLEGYGLIAVEVN